MVSFYFQVYLDSWLLVLFLSRLAAISMTFSIRLSGKKASGNMSCESLSSYPTE